MHANAELLFRKYALPYFGAASRVLEIGPDDCPSTLQRACTGRYAEWSTVDLETGPLGRLTYAMTDENVIPTADSAFDVLVSSSVIEHVRRPWRWYPELARVTATGGLVITIAPVSWPEHKGGAVPFDCWRILPDGMRVLVEDSGMKMLTCVMESLEPAAQGRWYPGGTYRFLQPVQPKREALLAKGFDVLARRPRPAAVDCLTVAQKN